jgi:Tol biopolymer transport system component
MNTDRDFDRIAMAWLADGPEELSDRVLDAVVDEIHVTRQRHALRLPWRFSTMTTPARVAVAAVIGVLLVGGALVAIDRSRPAVGGPGSSPTPVVTAVPSVAPSASPVAQTDYSDVPGRLLVQHLGNALDGSEASATDPNYGTRRFYLMDPDGSNITELLPGTPAAGKNHADISPDGTKVVFMDWADVPAIHEVNLDGTGYRQITTDCNCDGEGDPAYSSDGKQIAFVRKVGSTFQVGIRDLATDKVTMLAETEGLDSGGTGSESPEQPSWSPDGTEIIYQVTTRDGSGQLLSSRVRIIDIETRATRDLPISPNLKAGEPKFSPDGSLILFVSGAAEQTLGAAFGDVYTIKPDGTAMTQLTPDEGTGASWTPDGKHIVFYSQNYIWLMDPDGQNKHRWSLDGPDLSANAIGFGYTTYWIPAAP